jgi:hypothetical protein
MPVSIPGIYLLDNSQKLVLDPKQGQGWYVEELYLAKIGKYVYNGLFKIEEIIIQNYFS